MRECELTSKSGSHGTDHAEVGITCDSRQINVFTKAKMRSYCTADEQCNWLRYSIEHYLLVVAAPQHMLGRSFSKEIKLPSEILLCNFLLCPRDHTLQHHTSWPRLTALTKVHAIAYAYSLALTSSFPGSKRVTAAAFNTFVPRSLTFVSVSRQNCQMPVRRTATVSIDAYQI